MAAKQYEPTITCQFCEKYRSTCTAESPCCALCVCRRPQSQHRVSSLNSRVMQNMERDTDITPSEDAAAIADLFNLIRGVPLEVALEILCWIRTGSSATSVLRQIREAGSE